MTAPAFAATTRPWTPDEHLPGGGKRIHVKRCCNSCGRVLGDVTEAEIEAGVAGRPLPDVTAECGCSRRRVVVEAIADLAEHYACPVCGDLAPCEHTARLGVEAGDDAARFLMALSDVLPLLTDDAVALVADRLLGDPDA